MSKTNYLQAVISDLQRTAGPYRCAIFGHASNEDAPCTSRYSLARVRCVIGGFVVKCIGPLLTMLLSAEAAGIRWECQSRSAVHSRCRSEFSASRKAK